MPTHGSSALDLDAPLTLESAAQFVHEHALVDGPVGTVGLELEAHLVDFADVSARVPWSRIVDVLPDVVRAAGSSDVTLEPGGQVELSGPPAQNVVSAIDALRLDMQRVRLALADCGLGLAHLGSDPLRPPRRVNPKPRYQAMEQHFLATDRGIEGRTMMNSTAALQVNLQAGPAAGWAARVGLAHALGPTLLAISACSRYLHGNDTGLASARQRAWSRLDRHSGPREHHGASPAEQWSRYAMRAPVLFECGAGEQAVAVREHISFGRWASGAVRIGGRTPTLTDLTTHLTTLFPPVRLRGFLELRYMDACPPRWWPALAAVATVLLDDPVAADAAAEAVENSAELWDEAARLGLRDARLASSARRLLSIATARCPAQASTAVADLADLVESGSSPGDLIAARIGEVGVVAAWDEASHA